jgi:competence protein ComEC
VRGSDARTWSDDVAALRAGSWAGALADAFAAERARWALWLPVAMGAGAALFFALRTDPPAWAGLLALAASLAAWTSGRRRTEAALAALLCAAAAAGFCAAQLRTAVAETPVLERRLGPVEVVGRVAEVDRREDGVRAVLGELRVERLPADRTPRRVRIGLRGDAAPVPGSVVRVRAVLLPPPGPAEPGAFDYRRFAYFQGIGATGYAVGAWAEARAEEPGWGTAASAALERARVLVADRVAEVVPQPAAGVTAALMNGDVSGVTAEAMDWFRASGLAHLLSISGLHIGLVAGGVMLAVRAALAAVPPIALRWPIKKIAALAAFAAAAAYTVLVGAPVPTLRSLLMTGLVLLAVLADRSAISMRTVAAAAAAVIAVAPEAVSGPSFQMSFGAVVALIAAWEAVQPRLTAWRAGSGLLARGGLYVGGVALTSVVATLATGPFALYHFQQLPVLGVAANMVAVPLTAFWVMPCAVVAGVLMPLGLDEWPLRAMGWGVALIVETARVTAEAPGAVLRVPAIGPDALVLVVLGALWLCLWQRRWRLLGLLPVAAGIAAALAAPARPHVLVPADGAPVAVRAADGTLSVSSRRGGEFERQAWARRDGRDPDEAETVWPRDRRSRDGLLDCTPDVCLYRAEEVLVALVRGRAGIERACASAQVVVTALPTRGCWAPVVIDRDALRRDGAHAVRLEDGRWSVETARDRLGRRPWTPR